MNNENKDPNVEFLKSQAYKNIKTFLFQIDNAIKNSGDKFIESYNDHLMSELKFIDQVVDATELEDYGRFANNAMVTVIDQIQMMPENMYLKEAFGNKIRMDYGTGHELNFLCYLYLILSNEDGVLFDINDNIAFILVNLHAYMRICRKFIKKYTIEPAGARGSWSVDDYSLIGYVLGSSINAALDAVDCESQCSIVAPEEGRSHLLCYFKDMMKEAVGETPNKMLINILTLGEKAMNVGFMRMYDEEVLKRKVVTQHFIYSDKLGK